MFGDVHILGCRVKPGMTEEVRPGMTGGEEVAEEALFFRGQGAGFDFLAVIFYPVQETTVFYLLFVGKVVVLIDVGLELTKISVPNFVASGEHCLEFVYVGVFSGGMGFRVKPGMTRRC